MSIIVSSRFFLFSFFLHSFNLNKLPLGGSFSDRVTVKFQSILYAVQTLPCTYAAMTQRDFCLSVCHFLCLCESFAQYVMYVQPSGPVLFCHVHYFPFLCVSVALPCVFCCDVVELGTYGKLKYYHSMTEEGKFREKASILHKIAKKKCQVEDSEKANGVASRAEKNLPNSSSVEVEEVTPPMNGTAGQEGETHAPLHLRLDLPKTRLFPQSSMITVLANLPLATAGCCKRDLFDKWPHAEPHLAGASGQRFKVACLEESRQQMCWNFSLHITATEKMN
ncbi:hypothetical protein ILYODFUR_008920 [Ilyodon furcidens]|uniref:Uncharacterized protein n=1 Tax=Ilyodon furcidens TaxID=33524 RepID=A0ABV0SJN9_9TELE